MHVTGILLAAGRAERFGGDKLLAQFADGPNAGMPIGVVAYRNLRAAIDDVIVAVRPGDDTLRHCFESLAARIVIAARAADGLGATLAAAVRSAADADGYVVALGDMPWIEPATIARVASELALGASIVAPRYRGVRGHPVAFSSVHREALASLEGDEGARGVIERNRDALILVDVEDPGVNSDVDVPQPGIVARLAS